jgi:putative spermidine/putrescine transport system permease protein
MITFMFTLGFFITPALLGGGRVIMVAEYISVKTLVLAQLGEPAMLAVVLMASVFLLLMTLGRALNLRELLSGGSK